MENSTIAAVATPYGVGGIGVVRLSGPNAIQVAERVFRPAGSRSISKMTGYTSLLGRVCDGKGDIDEAILALYRSPKSYTGEDVVELSCHGGTATVQAVLRVCLENGAVMAGPGEFTRRALVAGKLDLAQAEAIMDLIAADGESTMRLALAGRDGALSQRISQLVGTLAAQAAHLSAWADYPEEDLELVNPTQLEQALRDVLSGLDKLLATYDQFRLLREGVRTVIVGKPNAGKSTLMNLLVGEQRSIVTDIPGTTRDVIEGKVQVGNQFLLLADTAGLRQTQDPVEQIGVQMAYQRIEQADLVLAVFDSSDTLSDEDRDLLRLLDRERTIAVVNKVDLPTQLDDSQIKAALDTVLSISALDRDFQQVLAEAIEQKLQLEQIGTNTAVVANERQRECLVNAKRHLGEALEAVELGVTFDAVTVCIESALDQLLAITGERVTERVVDEVFARFCVGK